MGWKSFFGFSSSPIQKVIDYKEQYKSCPSTTLHAHFSVRQDPEGRDIGSLKIEDFTHQYFDRPQEQGAYYIKAPSRLRTPDPIRNDPDYQRLRAENRIESLRVRHLPGQNEGPSRLIYDNRPLIYEYETSVRARSVGRSCGVPGFGRWDTVDNHSGGAPQPISVKRPQEYRHQKSFFDGGILAVF